MKKIITGLVLMLSMYTALGYADDVKIEVIHNNKQALIIGQSSGVSAELFQIMERAGLPSKSSPENVRRLTGRRLFAEANSLNGITYRIYLRAEAGAATLKKAAGGVLGHTYVLISGDVAEELYGAMAKAGLPFQQRGQNRTYEGRNVLCTTTPAHGAVTSCSILVVQKASRRL